METTLLNEDEIRTLKNLRTIAADAANGGEVCIRSQDALWLLDLVTRIANDAKTANDQLTRTINLFRLTLKSVL